MISESRLTAVIVDDEPLARTHLRRMLETQDVDVCAEANDAVEALQFTEDKRPDLIFLDVQMPGLNGMQVAGALMQMDDTPLVIFVTGYSQHAVAAFEHDALDYLLKPVAHDRLARTLVRARERLRDRCARGEIRERVAERARGSEPLRRLPVREDYVVRLIRVEELLCATSREKRVWVQTARGEYKTYYTLTQLEALLPADRFLRVHESCVVNLDAIEELIFLGNHAYTVRLSNGQQLPVGRTRYTDLQRRLGIAPERSEP